MSAVTTLQQNTGAVLVALSGQAAKIQLPFRGRLVASATVAAAINGDGFGGLYCHLEFETPSGTFDSVGRTAVSSHRNFQDTTGTNDIHGAFTVPLTGAVVRDPGTYDVRVRCFAYGAAAGFNIRPVDVRGAYLSVIASAI